MAVLDSIRESQFLGHVVNADGIKVDPVKVRAVMEWEPLRTTSKFVVFLVWLAITKIATLINRAYEEG